MDTDIWLPLATLLGGWGLAQVTEVLKDQRASNREHQARQSELQRTTLLALQDVLLDLTNLVYKAVMTLPGSPREHPDEKANKEAARRAWAAKTSLREATDKARLLISRVQDDEVRKEATSLVTAADRAGNFNLDEAIDAFDKVEDGYSQLVDRLGMLLRERY
jgi:hypothetical protein